MGEEEWIERARGGCSKSFRSLVEMHGPALFRFLFRLTRKAHDAEDLYQETLLKIARNLRGYDHQGQFSAWMFRIAKNTYLDSKKKKALEESPLHEGLPDAEFSSEKGFSTGEQFHRDLQVLVDQLPEKQREVFLLRTYGERTFKEIAEALGAPLGTVLARMSYAVQKLRPRLQAALAAAPTPSIRSRRTL